MNAQASNGDSVLYDAAGSGEPGQRGAAASARGRPERGELRFPAAHPQSGIRGTRSVSPRTSVMVQKMEIKKCVNI